jgi:NAD(P)-dependent dehydrogenase (short-subunit alcohol dehydrogenase family)
MATVGVVTGAARGMGAACAVLVRESCDVVVLVDRDPFEPGPLGGDVEVVPVDVADRGEVDALAARVAERGPVHRLVHAAGISPTMADAGRVFDVDLHGSAAIVEAFGPVMADGGSAVLFASMAAHLVAPVVDDETRAVLAEPLAADARERFLDLLGEGRDPGLAYGLAKFGVLDLVRRNAAGWAARGARINSVSPGSIDTPMGRAELEGQPAMRAMLEQTPFPRLGTAEEVAAVAGFLLSPAAAFVTGTDVLVDGGLVASVRSA